MVNECCNDTGFAAHAAVPCPNPSCTAVTRRIREMELGGPDDGHQFHFSVACQGSGAVVGQPHTDDDWIGEPMRLTVRAWNLVDACAKAATVPFPRWTFPPEDKFTDWPENLPREDLVRLLRGFANECRLVEQVIATAFPDEYPAGDGEVIPAHQRVVIDDDALALAGKAVAEIARLRSELDRTSREWVRDLEVVGDRHRRGGLDDADFEEL